MKFFSEKEFHETTFKRKGEVCPAKPVWKKKPVMCSEFYIFQTILKDKVVVKYVK